MFSKFMNAIVLFLLPTLGSLIVSVQDCGKSVSHRKREKEEKGLAGSVRPLCAISFLPAITPFEVTLHFLFFFLSITAYGCTYTVKEQLEIVLPLSHTLAVRKNWAARHVLYYSRENERIKSL